MCWLLGTSVRKTRRFLRTDVPSSQHKPAHENSNTQMDDLRAKPQIYISEEAFYPATTEGSPAVAEAVDPSAAHIVNIVERQEAW